MNAIFLPGLIIFGFFTLMYVSYNISNAIKTYSDKRDKANKENKAWNTEYIERYLEYLDERVKGLQNDRIKNCEVLNNIEILKGRLDVVDNWRKNTLKGYCFKRIEFEEKENKAHLLVVCDPNNDGVLHTKHVECELVSEFSAQESIKKVAVPITMEQANDYFDNGFEWVPVYEKYADWPNMI